MIKPKRFPKIRFVNLRSIGYIPYWNNWKNIEYNLTPYIRKYWHGQIIHVGWPCYYLELDFRRGNIIDQMTADNVVRNLPKN